MAVSFFGARVLRQMYIYLRVSFNPTDIPVRKCNGFGPDFILSTILII